MTAFTPNTTGDNEARLSTLILSLALDETLDVVRFQLLGHELVLEGQVASYDEKRRIERAAREAGFRIQNALRVIPAAFHPNISSTI
jgi:diphthamide synthase (EF-2-diphthine--ammonia ligase)